MALLLHVGLGSSARGIQRIHEIPRQSRRGTDKEFLVCRPIIDRWQDLEAGQADSTQPTRSAALFPFLALLGGALSTRNLVLRSEV